jgi:hypothetical protein
LSIGRLKGGFRILVNSNISVSRRLMVNRRLDPPSSPMVLIDNESPLDKESAAAPSTYPLTSVAP